MTKDYQYLTPEQVDQFMEHGYIVVKNAFTPEQAADFTKDLWVRLDMDPNDKTTWTKERIHMPRMRVVSTKEFAPKAWGAITDLVGGEDKIEEYTTVWGDSFIVNLGADEWEDKTIQPSDLDNWHVDGDFFVHFLDSPEQGLLVTPLWAPIAPQGGGTYIAPDGIDLIAHYLAQHPEGVLATGLSFTPSDWESKYTDKKQHPAFWDHLKEVKRCERFVELTGDVGDVIICHPLMLHSASKNHTRIPRVITNPPIALTRPFDFNRANPEDYSLVERKTLKALGVDRLDFKLTTPRRRVVPERVRIQQRMAEEEKARLEAQRNGTAANPGI